MFQLSERLSRLRENAVFAKPHSRVVSAQREYYYTLGVAKAAETHRGDNAWLSAAGTAEVIRGALAVIEDGEIIVGHNFGVIEDIGGLNDARVREALRSGLFSDEDIDRYFVSREIARSAFYQPDFPDFETEKQRQLCAEMASMGDVATCNHTVLGYEQVLKHGFEGLLDRVSRYEAQNGGCFYGPLRQVCLAGCELGDKYARKAEEMLTAESDAQRRLELRDIAEACSQVPRRPARSFREAVQSLWFAHMINTWEDYINANSLGRLDQILYPYYKADTEKGALTKEEAFELICHLWLKLYRDYDVQQSCVGGCDRAGNPAVNDLSYLMLDATEALDFVRCLSLRYSADTEKAFIQRALGVVGHVQKGVPFFFNDDVMIPALTDSGITLEDARDYTQIGCVETVIPGKSNPHAVTARANLLKAVEYAMANGRSMLRPELHPGLETGDSAEFGDFESFKNAVFNQIRHIIEQACRMTVARLKAAAALRPKPYKSLLTEGCIENGRDFNDGGAKYDYYQIMLLGVPNLADSLAAVRELVYVQGKYTLEELRRQLEDDFSDEAVRLDFVNRAPKFGNDIEEVDRLAAEIIDSSCDFLHELSERLGRVFHAQPFTYLWMIDHGEKTAATPDGRRAREIMAYSVSPMQGRDCNGFTALINSLSRLPSRKTPGTCSAIVEVEPHLFSDRNMSGFADILLAAAGKGLSNVQFNVVSADTLREAQKHPDKYKNLAVRVSGFSQKFYLLDKALQDHIISRTKHGSV